VPVPYFSLFLFFRKVTQEIFLELDKIKDKVPSYLTWRRSSKESRRWTRGQPHPRVARPSLGPRHQGVWPPSPPPNITLLPIYSPRREIPRGLNFFPENILQATGITDARSGGSRSSSWHPAGEGSHHRRPSSSPCLPPKWCVSSLPWTRVARWLSSPPCASYLDLVSCLAWSRSSLCNSTYCVCWDPMNIEYYVKLIYDLSSLCCL
jgi:hypothetical protein